MYNSNNRNFNSESQNGNSQESNYELSPEFEFNNPSNMEYSNEYSNEYMGENEFELSPEFEYQSQETEMQESEFAQELMELSNEAEFGAWLKRLGKKTAGVASGFLNSPIGQQATAALGNIAQKTLPSLASKAGAWAGGKLGGIVGKSDYGRQLGQQLGGQAGQAASGRYPDFVKFATDALSGLSREFETGAVPAVKPAIVKAARKHYPIILKVKGTLYARQEQGNMNNEFEYNNEYNNEYSNEYNNEFSNEYNNEGSFQMEGEMANESTFNEVMEMELASELLSIQSEAELDQFLGKLFKKATGALSRFAKSGIGRSLGGMLKGIAKKALPLAGNALGTLVAPGIGTSIGGALGSAASNLFELELEGLSAEDREFEVARSYVRFAGNAARRASRMGNNIKPTTAARNSIIQSARKYAPGLLIRNRTSPVINDQGNYMGGDENSDAGGTWYREGNRIVIEGA